MGFFLVFPYFLCTFAQIELLTHAYDALQQKGHTGIDHCANGFEN